MTKYGNLNLKSELKKYQKVGMVSHKTNVTNHIVNEKNRQEYRDKREKRIEEEYGRDLNSYSKGRDARLAGLPLDLSKCKSEESRRSYYKGYVYGGNRQIKMTAMNGITEMALIDYYGISDKNYDKEKYGLPTRKEFAISKTPEYLYIMGYCDAYHEVINYHELPEEIKNNPNYTQGYNDAKELIETNKKKR